MKDFANLAVDYLIKHPWANVLLMASLSFGLAFLIQALWG